MFDLIMIKTRRGTPSASIKETRTNRNPYIILVYFKDWTN